MMSFTWRNIFVVKVLLSIDRSALSIDRAAPSRDLLLAQPSMDRAALSMDEHRPVLSGFRAR